MSRLLVSFAAGLVFAVGLGVSGMTRPSKVRGFLDLFGAWDPSLAFVMVGAIGVYAAAWQVAKRRERALLGDAFDLPDATSIDGRLLGGAAIFGVGWGLGGYCPGPAVVATTTGQSGPLLFVGAMLVGMVLTRTGLRREGAGGV